MERGLLPDPEGYHCGRHVSAVCLSLSINAKVSFCEGDRKFSHKLCEVCIFVLYLNMVNADRWHEVSLTAAYIEDINYFCFLVEVYLISLLCMDLGWMVYSIYLTFHQREREF